MARHESNPTLSAQAWSVVVGARVPDQPGSMQTITITIIKTRVAAVEVIVIRVIIIHRSPVLFKR
jgi:hypothetical protein